MRKETEMKFESLANTQLKFIPIENTQTIERRLTKLCQFLGITTNGSRTMKIVDSYYDDEQETLLIGGYSLRVRRQNGGLYITMKGTRQAHSVACTKNEVCRLEDEFRCNDNQMHKLLSTPEQVQRGFLKRLGVSLTVGKLLPVLTVVNRRTTLPLKTPIGSYNLCYDKFYYYNDTGTYSEYFSELEIEHIGDTLSQDELVGKLAKAVQDLLEYSPTNKSKFCRGMEWFRSGGQSAELIYTVGMDIIGYSQHTASTQKQMIQKLNYYTKDAIREVRGSTAAQNTVYLPTGDGMILAFSDRPETLVPIVFNVQNKIKAYNRNVGRDAKFEFRAGLHYGPVFKYSDVNENLNFAGSGINLVQRVMSLGDKWHILATQEGYRSMGDINTELQPLFKLVGPYPIKHGKEITIYNVYDEHLSTGNPSKP